MPQLNPGPWFLYLILSWLTFFIVMNKVSNLVSPNELNPVITEKIKTKPWDWPW
uniref:ATP synthase complex subunit 8 n=1 Tax=Clypeobarbus pleuropholis TaxID=643461 RepID=A0A1E1FMQ9_9TELE|nr:ATP synthase F0 subunit 8 [Clypeobarbus pleuropholis]BAV71787.1 ATPase subunit 8 [Clypeobarbus pleuropholis]